MRLKLSVLILLAGLSSQAANASSEFATGRACYTAGAFTEAVAHFQLSLKDNPDDAESYYWMGMSYQVLADIAAPFNGRYNSKARVSLTKAMELAPSRSDYRRALFDFLLDSADSSPAALRQAAAILRTVPEPDPEYSDMHRRFELERSVNGSATLRLGRLFLAAPRVLYRIGELPASALSSRPEAGVRAAMR
jgi:tetratricopeptide (TPR) repeat protein